MNNETALGSDQRRTGTWMFTPWAGPYVASVIRARSWLSPGVRLAAPWTHPGCSC